MPKPKKTKPIAKSAMQKAVKQIVKKEIKKEIEPKYVTFEQGFGNVPTTFNANPQSLIYQLGINQYTDLGLYNPISDNYGMEGMEINCLKLELGYTLYMTDEVPEDANASVRIMVVWDNEPASDTSFSSTLSLYSATSNYDDIILRDAYLHAQPYAFLRGVKKNPRFTIIYDKIHRLGASGNGSLYQVHRKTIDLHNKRLKFSSTTAGTVYPMTANLLLLQVALGNDAGATVQGIFGCRTWFTDA